jgi:hypothetical protein
MVRQEGKLDWELIEQELAHRCSLIEDNEPLDTLRRLKAKLKH